MMLCFLYTKLTRCFPSYILEISTACTNEKQIHKNIIEKGWDIGSKAQTCLRSRPNCPEAQMLEQGTHHVTGKLRSQFCLRDPPDHFWSSAHGMRQCNCPSIEHLYATHMDWPQSSRLIGRAERTYTTNHA